MSLLNKLNQDMKQALKQKDKNTLNVIRMVKSSIQNECIELGKTELSEDEELNVISRELKQRKDSLQEFKNANRSDLVENAKTEMQILQKYMPQQLTDKELDNIIQTTIQEINATSTKDMGHVMQSVMPKIKGKADGKRVNQIATYYLSQ